jgi:hypothetical protein
MLLTVFGKSRCFRTSTTKVTGLGVRRAVIFSIQTFDGYPGCVLFWCGDWNDQISSMGATNTKVIYYRDINFQGPTLTVYPYIAVPDLRVYGWNDAISSVWNIP